MSPEKVKFHFDPRCPWCYQTSRWVVRLEQLNVIDVEWGLFSLDIQNAAEGVTMTAQTARSGAALCTIIALRKEGHGDLIGDLYTAIGKQWWEQELPQEDMSIAVREALEVIGLDPAICDKALADESNWQAVMEEQEALVTRTRSFGVPTIILDGGDGPAIFGPVVSSLPTDEDAVELWKHVSWLARYENFSELKRDRVAPPDLPAMAYRAKHQPAK